MGVSGLAGLIAAENSCAGVCGLLATLEDAPGDSCPLAMSARQEKCAPVGAPSRSLFSLLDARFATARLIDQCVHAAVAILAAPRLDRRLAGNLVLDHGFTDR